MAGGKTTRRNRKKKSRGNVLHYQIPGLNEAIDIPFPDRKLPVCKRCKKIFKTRELCRVRDGHTSVPWNTTYLCVSLDDSCITSNEKGETLLVPEGPGPDTFRFLARSLPGPMMPYMAKQGDIDMDTAPICLTCKQKNYTKTHCRKKQQHLFLPWSTVFVMLYAIPYGNAASDNENSPPPVKRAAPETGPISSSDEIAAKKAKVDESKSPTGNEDASARGAETSPTRRGGPSVIQKIETSRTFLLTIQPDECCTLTWLEFDPDSKNFVPVTSTAEDNERNFHSMTGGMYSSMHHAGYPMDYNQGGGGMMGYPPGPWHPSEGNGGFPYQGNPEYDMPHSYGGYPHGGGGMADYGNGPPYPMDQGGYMEGGGPQQQFNPYFMHQQNMSHMGGAPNLYNNANAYYDSFMGPQMNMHMMQGQAGDPNGPMGGRGHPGDGPSRLNPKDGIPTDKNAKPGQHVKDPPQAKSGGPHEPSYGPGPMNHLPSPHGPNGIPGNPNFNQVESREVSNQAKQSQSLPSTEEKIGDNGKSHGTSAIPPESTGDAASSQIEESESSGVPVTGTEVAV